MGLGVFEEFADYILGTELELGWYFIISFNSWFTEDLNYQEKRVFKMTINKNFILYLAILIFGLVAPFFSCI